ncbi:NAD(P)-dependent oxidoreductase [Actinoplanes subtropicus]|uniref:NAD(P)-dependent oxidoreductase n=1 Tax=Actinoplanes subtropicus TaxID=543632 RepID=UPI0004C472B9|nr:NAD(P)H-binding protein [Actinoplanes subtropicus]
MKIIVYGATGRIGSRVAAEAVTRGHDVTGVSRSGGDLPPGAVAVRGDACDPVFAKGMASTAEVIVAAIAPDRSGGNWQGYLDGLSNLAATAGDARLIIVGGGASLTLAGHRMIDLPGFPAPHRKEAMAGIEGYELIRTHHDDIDWTFISPAPLVGPGERTGSYRVGVDHPAGEGISFEDVAVALIDEIEKPAHRRGLFSVAH